MTRPARFTLLTALLASLAGAGLLGLSSSPGPAPLPDPPAPPSAPAARPLPQAEPSAPASASEAPEAASLPPCEGAEVRALIHENDVHLCRPGQGWQRLTHHGKAASVALSPSRRLALYARDEGEETVPLGSSDTVKITDTRLVLLDLDRGSEREVARNDPKTSGCLSLRGARFVDDSYALVHADGYGAANVHNHSMCGVDLARGKLVMVGRRSSCAVPLTAGRYRGMLWVVGFDFKVGQGLSDWQGVVDRQGRRVRYFEDDPFAVDHDKDGSLDNNERDILCADPPADPATAEALQRKM